MNPAGLQAQCPELRDLKLIRPLSGGGSWNETWLAGRGRERLAVRLDTPAVRALGLDRAAEAAALRLIQGHGIGPELIFADPSAGVLATRWLPGRPCAPAMLRNRRLLRALGALLRRLHETIAPPPALPPLDLPQAVARYASVVGSLWARRTARAAARSLRAAVCGRLALCHNDPVAQNILRGPSLRLIDWEFAAPGDPLFDLAAVVGHHRLGARRARVLLAAARGRIYASDWRSLTRLAKGYRHLLALWEAAALRCARPRSRASRPQVPQDRHP